LLSRRIIETRYGDTPFRDWVIHPIESGCQTSIFSHYERVDRLREQRPLLHP